MKYLLLPILFCYALQVQAQHSLSSSPLSAAYTYVFKIPDQALLPMLKETKFRPDIFTTPIDSFHTEKEDAYHPAPGNYLYVTATSNLLQQEIKCFPNIYIYLLNQTKGYKLILQDKNGALVDEANVTKYQKGKYLFIKYQGVTNLFRIEKGQRFKNKITPPKRLPYQGYIAFSKPTYQPNDTVKLKAFITDKKGRPINGDAQLRLSTYDNKTDTILTTLHPYRPGGYEYQFIMRDTMVLDKSYTISLEQNDITLKSANYQFERYELAKIRMEVSTNTTWHQRHEPVTLSILTKDENDLPLLDARVMITVTASKANAWHATKVFLPDTLWQQTITPEAIGETLVQLPDSIFPAADIDYFIHCRLLNSDNQSLLRILSQRYTDQIKNLMIEEDNDSLFINMMVGGKSTPDTGTLYIYSNAQQLIRSIPVTMPWRMPLPSNGSDYIIQSGELKERLVPNNSRYITCESMHTADSAFFLIDNPDRFPFWYTITDKRNKVITQGYAQSLNWRRRAPIYRDYFLEVHYLRNNSLMGLTATAHYDPSKLQIAIHAPDTIAPGQTSHINIAVTDSYGTPVPDADITAYALTSKFRDGIPYIPSFSQTVQPKGSHRSHDNVSLQLSPVTDLLNYQYWRSRMGLDTITWFRFINPSPVFRFEEPAIDSVTQIAPFVFIKGDYQGSHIVYIDHIPVFYANAQQATVYSFRTTPGTHLLQIRTHKMLITYDSILVHAGVKNFVSIDPTNPGKGITVEKLPDHLIQTEADMLNRYMVQVNHSSNANLKYISQGDNLLLLSSNQQQIVGPLTGAPASLTLYKNFTQEFTPAEGYYFTISPGLIIQRERKPMYTTKTQLSNDDLLYDLSDQVLTNTTLAKLCDNEDIKIRITHPPYGYHQPTDPFIGTFVVSLPADTLEKPVNIALRRYADTGFIRMCSGNATEIYGLDTGRYQVLYLYNDRYFTQDSVDIKSNGLNYAKITHINWQYANPIPEDTTCTDTITMPRKIRGVVKDHMDEALIGASVKIPGTSISVATDEEGLFELEVPPHSTLMISYVGFESLTLPLSNKNEYLVSLQPGKVHLDEVVVSGLRITKEDRKTNFAMMMYKKSAPTITLSESAGSGTVEPPPPPVIRTKFKDDAFWQPTLRTDTNGMATFQATFPDDITNWRIIALGMNDHQQSGTAISYIKAMKAVSANLATPAFGIAGDTMHIIGKALNYTADTLPVNSTFTVNDSVYHRHAHRLINAVIDTLPVVIPVRDSMHFTYAIQQDGERHSIPVFPAGVKADTGLFAALYADTTITYKPVLNSPVTVYAEAALLPVLEDEMQHIWRYKYLCNEQMASKLKAYLLSKQHHEKEIIRLINRLQKTQRDGMWGWWENTTPTNWITQHVLEALQMAKEKGFTINTDENILIQDLLSAYHSGKVTDSIGTLFLLAQLKAKLDYATLIAQLHPHNLYDSLRVLTLAQRMQLPVNVAPIIARQQTTPFGNIHWGNVQNTLFAYRLLRGNDARQQKILGYFLEQRRNGHWMNTYESALILETILPDIKDKDGKASLTINGKTVDQFPYQATLSNQPITINKKGALPMYLTATQSYWDANPVAVAKTFTVKSTLDQAILEAGKPVTLTVQVNASARAEYVLVEIPIPAGCSYAAKPQSWMNNEVHREYQQEMVSIFCSQLEKGNHTFKVQLMPRYSGTYTLNPAKVEMQYFPLFMGREGMKKVHIR